MADRKTLKNKTQQAYIKTTDNQLESSKVAIDPNDPYKKYKEFKWQDPDRFKNGPVGDDNRKCRDCICCIIFIIFFIACVFVGYLGFTKGQPTAFLYVYDEIGNACGHSEGYEDYPFLYFYSVISGVQNLDTDKILNGVCVKKCPDDKKGSISGYVNLECKTNTKKTDCKVLKKDYYESKEVIGRICFPVSNDEIEYDENSQIKVKIYDPNTGDYFYKIVDTDKVIYDTETPSHAYILADEISGDEDPQKASARLINFAYFSQKFASWISDLNVTKYAIAGSIGWSFFICIFFIIFLKLCAGFITFLIILVIQAGLIILAFYFKYMIKHKNVQDDSTYETTMNVFFYVFVGLSCLWFIFILLMCNRIRLAIALVQVTSKYIMKNCCIIFIPFFFFFMLLIWIVYWVVMLVFLYASGEFDQEGSKVIASFKMDKNLIYCFWFHVFALFFMTAIISAYSQFVYASSACIWYFTAEKGTEDHPIAKSFKRGIRYHWGSLCFGAAIIAIIRFIMFFLEYIKKKIETTGANNKSKFIKCVISCLQCFLGCCAKVMEFINKHAYIQIALKGDSFCTAAWEGFGLVIRNLGRFSMLALIGGILSTFGTIFITVASAVIGYFVITKVEYFSADLNSCVLPVCAFGLVGFIMGHVTMSIFSVSGDALIHSFLLDEELNKGLPKAFPELQKFMSDER